MQIQPARKKIVNAGSFDFAASRRYIGISSEADDSCSADAMPSAIRGMPRLYRGTTARSPACLHCWSQASKYSKLRHVPLPAAALSRQGRRRGRGATRERERGGSRIRA